LANNTAASRGGDCYGTVNSYGYNLIENTTNCALSYTTSGADATTDLTGQDPLLSSLADNGGPTNTQALSVDSTAIDAGSCTAIDASLITTDQRGEARDSLCDIGAYECTTIWYNDSDGDGYGDAATSITACAQPSGYVTNATDCDDTDSANYPGAVEVCGDGIDNDCNGNSDEGSAWYADTDQDGYGDAATSITACAQPDSYVAEATDCDDTDAESHPGQYDECTTEADEDCDGANDSCEGNEGALCTDGIDNDADGLTDCEDEECGGLNTACMDSDSDGVMDENDAFPNDATESNDTDGDGIGDNADCDDSNAANYPGATEICGDGIDQNCDELDPVCASEVNLDDDGDGIPDTTDNCPLLANADQLNTDSDTDGDVCDSDDDGDGVADAADAFPLNASEFNDADGDGTGDNADFDDGNSINDADEVNNSGDEQGTPTTGDTPVIPVIGDADTDSSGGCSLFIQHKSNASPLTTLMGLLPFGFFLLLRRKTT